MANMLQYTMNMEYRGICFQCRRPLSSCMCTHVKPIETHTKFVILMHPKEHRKNKNGTGYLTHLALPNSELHVGIDFSAHKQVNALINDPNNTCYLLYPSQTSIDLNREPIGKEGKQNVIFILDSTWACSRKMLRLSQNLQALPSISFSSDRISRFQIKRQPESFCLSTIESTQVVLELLSAQGCETISPKKLDDFLYPFQKMVAYQIDCAEKEHNARYCDRDNVSFQAKRGKRRPLA